MTITKVSIQPEQLAIVFSLVNSEESYEVSGYGGGFGATQ